MKLVKRIADLHPDIGFGDEPSLNDIVFAYYAKHSAGPTAGTHTASYFAALEALAAAKTVLTERQQQVLSALTDAFEGPRIIANRAKITTSSPGETAAKFCIQLVALGLAEKGGSPQFPKWRKMPATES